MADLELNPQTKHVKDNSVADIMRLGEKFRYLARNLTDVFIQSSRQGIVHTIETDPEEEETRERLTFFSGISRRYRERKKRKNYTKPQLVSVDGKVVQPKSNPKETPIVRAEVKPASSLLEAARGFATIIEGEKQVVKEEEPAVVTPKIKLNSNEQAKYNNYADLAEQFLSQKQFPHYRTLLDKAQEEMSVEAVTLLKALGEKHGFSV